MRIVLSLADGDHGSSIRPHCPVPSGGNAATSACQTFKCSMPSSMWPSMAASGGGCRPGLATGTPSTCAMNRWSKSGVLDRVFEQLQRQQIVRLKLEAVSLDSTIIKVHPDGTGAANKNGPQSIGRSRGGWTTKLHMVAADARTAVTFSLSPGQAHVAPKARVSARRAGGAQAVAPSRPPARQSGAYDGPCL